MKELMFKVVNYTTNTSMFQKITNDPFEVPGIIGIFDDLNKQAETYESYRQNSSNCFEFKIKKDIILIYIMWF